jgi:hypothetical protein
MNHRTTIARIRTEIQAWWDGEQGDKAPLSYYCWKWAAVTVGVLAEMGCSAHLVAGSARWRVVPSVLDDGRSPNHYLYQFEWTTAAFRELAGGDLPEMHVWVEVSPADDPTGRGELIDLTTRFIPARCQEKGIICMSFIPDYLWCPLDDIPQWAEYVPDPQATAIVLALLAAQKAGGPFHVPVLRPPTQGAVAHDHR